MPRRTESPKRSELFVSEAAVPGRLYIPLAVGVLVGVASAFSFSSRGHFYHPPTTVIMSPTSPENPDRANYQSVFDSALQEYKKKTRKDLPSNPLCHKLQSCDSPDDIIITLRQQIPGFDQSASGSNEDRLTKWLDPTVKVISAFSATIGGVVALVCLAVYEVARPGSVH